MFHRIAGVWVLVFAACCGAAFCFPAAGAPAAADGQGYVVRLARAAKVGDAAWFVADVTVVDSVAANVSGNDRNLKPEGVALHFEADERIEAVGARGEPMRATYRIEKCVLRGGKREILLLDPGTVLTVGAGRWKSSLRVDRGHLRVKE